MATEQTLYCSFCGKSQHDVSRLIAGPTVFICDECTELCMDIVREDDPIFIKLRTATVPTRSEIRDALDSAISGQKRVKEVLSIMLQRHFEGLIDSSGRDRALSAPSNLLICGPSIERYEIARALARCLPIPVAAVDVARLLEIHKASEVSQSVTRKLLDAADWHRGKAQRGIVYVDDFDHLGGLGVGPSNTSKVFCEEVQKALIDLMTGTVVEVPTVHRTALPVDTRRLTFVCAGTFLGLAKRIARPARRQARGRRSDNKGHDQDGGALQLSDAEAAILLEFGLLPGLVARLSGLVALE